MSGTFRMKGSQLKSNKEGVGAKIRKRTCRQEKIRIWKERKECQSDSDGQESTASEIRTHTEAL